MKISLSWVFDHIENPPTNVAIADLVAIFNEKVAEIEQVSLVKADISALTCAQITALDSNSVSVHIPEYAEDLLLPYRADAQDGHYALIRMTPGNTSATWAHMCDFGSSKEALLPLIEVNKNTNPHNWRNYIEKEDYILEIDNKSITHRPDLWCHRGVAREIAVIYGLSVKPLESLLATIDIQEFSGTASPTSKTAPILTINDKHSCRRLCCAIISDVHWSPSRLFFASRLCRIDSKPIDALVDTTNYVMFDIGSPMHAFDAATIRDHQITVRKAYVGESLRLIDGEAIALTSQDLILADGAKVVSLAGIMGSQATSITTETNSVLLEAGNFDPTSIRHSSARHKKRTEASLRFEKNIDPNSTVNAIRRYLYLLNIQEIPYTCETSLISIGPKIDRTVIEVEHLFLEKRLGIALESAKVIAILTALDFDVITYETAERIRYTITVPSNRSTKDILHKEDIVEEIGRIWGFNTIVPQLPKKLTSPTNFCTQQRSLKRILSLGLRMQEVYTYAFFDETWLRHLNFQPEIAITAQEPVSANWKRLVTTLIPNLLKAIHDNSSHHSELRFFEAARTWHKSASVIEKGTVSGAMYNANKKIDFYDYKADLESFFAYCTMKISWKRIDNILPAYPWFTPYQTAYIICEGTTIGIFGMIDTFWCEKIVPTGSIAAFELEETFLRSHIKDEVRYKPLSKYPDIKRDISLLIPVTLQTEQIQKIISNIDCRIAAVQLVDFFQKEEWLDKKSLTFSFIIRDYEKTLTGKEADVVYDAVATTLKREIGAIIR